MSKSVRTVLAAIAILLTCFAFAASFVPDAAACLPYGTYRYYSSSSYTVQVGTKIVKCNCVITTTGTVTSYVKFTAYTGTCGEPL